MEQQKITQPEKPMQSFSIEKEKIDKLKRKMEESRRLITEVSEYLNELKNKNPDKISSPDGKNLFNLTMQEFSFLLTEEKKTISKLEQQIALLKAEDELLDKELKEWKPTREH
jgi:hypothetical protein